jgi:hypothetical protein
MVLLGGMLGVDALSAIAILSHVIGKCQDCRPDRCGEESVKLSVSEPGPVGNQRSGPTADLAEKSTGGSDSSVNIDRISIHRTSSAKTHRGHQTSE